MSLLLLMAKGLKKYLYSPLAFNKQKKIKSLYGLMLTSQNLSKFFKTHIDILIICSMHFNTLKYFHFTPI